MASLEQRGKYNAQRPVADSTSISHVYKNNGLCLALQHTTLEPSLELVPGERSWNAWRLSVCLIQPESDGLGLRDSRCRMGTCATRGAILSDLPGATGRQPSSGRRGWPASGACRRRCEPGTARTRCQLGT